MLDVNRIASELKNYLDAPQLEAFLRVFEYIHTQTLADVPPPETGGA